MPGHRHGLHGPGRGVSLRPRLPRAAAGDARAVRGSEVAAGAGIDPALCGRGRPGHPDGRGGDAQPRATDGTGPRRGIPHRLSVRMDGISGPVHQGHVRRFIRPVRPQHAAPGVSIHERCDGRHGSGDGERCQSGCPGFVPLLVRDVHGTADWADCRLPHQLVAGGTSMSITVLAAYAPLAAASGGTGASTQTQAPSGPTALVDGPVASPQSQSGVTAPAALTAKNLNNGQGSVQPGLPARLQPGTPATQKPGNPRSTPVLSMPAPEFAPVVLSISGLGTGGVGTAAACADSSGNTVTASVYGSVYGAVYGGGGGAGCDLSLEGLPFPARTSHALRASAPTGLTATVVDDMSQVSLQLPSGQHLTFAPVGTSGPGATVDGAVYAVGEAFRAPTIWPATTLQGALDPSGYKETLEVSQWTG